MKNRFVFLPINDQTAVNSGKTGQTDGDDSHKRHNQSEKFTECDVAEKREKRKTNGSHMFAFVFIEFL